MTSPALQLEDFLRPFVICGGSSHGLELLNGESRSKVT